MSKWTIYHTLTFDTSVSGIVNQERIAVGEVEADCISQAFRNFNNIEDTWNKENPCRSTSVGDAILDHETGIVLMVTSLGFLEIDRFPIPEENDPTSYQYGE